MKLTFPTALPAQRPQFSHPTHPPSPPLLRFGASSSSSSSLDETVDVKTTKGNVTLRYGDILTTFAKHQKQYDGQKNVSSPTASKPLPNGYAAALIEQFGMTSLLEVGKVIRYFLEHGFLATNDPNKPLEALRLSDNVKPALSTWGSDHAETKQEEAPQETNPVNASENPAKVSPAKTVKTASGEDNRIIENGWDHFIEDFTVQASKEKFKSIIGQPDLRHRLQTELSKHFIHNLLISGESGLGKTSAIKDLSRSIAEKKAGPLNDKKIWHVDCSSLALADKEAWDKLLQFAEKNPDVILYFDQAQGLFSPDGTSLTEAGKQLGRFIHNPDIRLILEASLPVAQLLLTKNPDWAGHINRVNMEEPSRELTQEIIRETLPLLSQRHGVTYPEKVVQETVNMASAYLKNTVSPVRELDMLDAAGVKASMENRNEVTLEDLAKVISEKTGLPLGALSESERDKLLRLEEILHKRVVSQDEAINAVANAVRLRRVRLTDDEKGPVGTFIFLGPTGVGKTETVKALAEWWTGDEKNLIRIDMGEYMESHSVSRLVGAPPGYVGYEEGGQLTNAIRRRPFGVVVLDEFEKADRSIFKALLPLLDEGRLTDGQGNTVNAENYIFVLTGNVGAEEIQKLIEEAHQEQKQEKEAEAALSIKIATVVKKALKAIFKPEQLNRFDDIIVFKELADEAQREIVSQKLAAFLPKVEKKHRVTITLNDDAREFLTKKLFERKSAIHDRQGGRKANDVLKTYLKMPLADFMLKTPPQAGDHLIGKAEFATSGNDDMEIVFTSTTR